MIRKLIQAEFNQLGDDEVEVVMSTAALARDGHVLVPQGCRLENYRANPIVLWSHDPNYPLANAEDIVIEPARIRCRVRFAPAGISRKADEVRGLVKSGVVRAVSVGFDPIEGEPLDPRKPRGGQRFVDWDLLELSFCSVPVDTGAVVTNRSLGDETMPETPVEAATTPATPPAPSPDAKRQRAKPRAQAMTRAPKIVFQRGMCEVAELCHIFSQLGWQVDWAKWEADMEGDGSQVPAMLGSVMSALGEALLAMTAEEIAEALEFREIEPEEDVSYDEVLVAEERAHIAAAASPAVRAFRRGLAFAKIRAGKSLSAETVRRLRDAAAMHAEAVDMHRSAIRLHRDGMSAVEELLERAGATGSAESEAETGESERSVDAPAPAADPVVLNLEYRQRQADLMALGASR